MGLGWSSDSLRKETGRCSLKPKPLHQVNFITTFWNLHENRNMYTKCWSQWKQWELQVSGILQTLKLFVYPLAECAWSEGNNCAQIVFSLFSGCNNNKRSWVNYGVDSDHNCNGPLYKFNWVLAEKHQCHVYYTAWNMTQAIWTCLNCQLCCQWFHWFLLCPCLIHFCLRLFYLIIKLAISNE